MRKILLFAILLAGCQILVSSPSVPVPSDIAVGTSALEIDFSPTPSMSVVMCQQANVLVNLRNRGTADIVSGVQTFIVEEQVLYPLDKKAKPLSLEGKSKFTPVGGMMQAALKVKNVGLPSQLESYSTPVIFQACYPYETLASVPVCIDPDIQNVNLQKVCRSYPVSLGGGQGAPVAVTKVEPIMVPEQDTIIPTFAVYIQNLGTGRVVAEDSFAAACGVQKAETLKSAVRVSAELQNEELVCTPEAVSLEPGRESKIVCRSAGNVGLEQGTFTTLLHVALSYGYVSTATLPLTISRIPGQERC